MSTNLEFNSKRLTFARKRRGLTKTKLAEILGVEVRTITGYEGEEFKPDKQRLQILAEKLKFPIRFFFEDDLDEIEPDAVSFRSMSKMSAGQRDSALGAGTIALQFNEWVESRFSLPTAQLPDLSQEPNPEVAAETLRQMWGLGQERIKNMIHLIESKGIRVFSLSIDTLQLDAFSLWHSEPPFVFLKTKKSCEHSRFDAAHELGHLVLHRHAGAKGQEAEREANRFASAFLMPRANVQANAPYMATVNHLIKLKSLWTVSVAALAYRLHDIGIISDWHYRTLCTEIARKGYRTKEPQEAPREISLVLNKIFALLREEGVTKAQIAEDLSIFPEELDQLVFGLVLTVLSSTRGKSITKTAKPNLRVIVGNGENN